MSKRRPTDTDPYWADLRATGRSKDERFWDDGHLPDAEVTRARWRAFLTQLPGDNRVPDMEQALSERFRLLSDPNMVRALWRRRPDEEDS